MFDDIIRDKANEHEAPVPPDAWNNILKKKKKRRFGIFWWGGIALLLCGLAGAGYFLNQRGNDKSLSVYNNVSAVVHTKDKSDSTSIQKQQDLKQTSNAVKKTREISSHEDLQKTATAKSDGELQTVKPNRSTKEVKVIVGLTNNPSIRKSKSYKEKNNTAIASTLKNKKDVRGKFFYNATAPKQEEVNTATESSDSVGEAVVVETLNQEVKKRDSVETNSTAILADKQLLAAQKSPALTEIKKDSTKIEQQTKKTHWFIDAGITPLIIRQGYDASVSFQRTHFANNNLTIYNANLIKTSVDPAVSFSIGVRRTLNNKITLGVGLQYLLLKENITMSGKETNTMYSEVQRLSNGVLVTDTVQTVTEGIRNIKAINSYHLFSIPLFVQYNMVQKAKWNLSGVAGIYVNINSSYQNEIDRNAMAPLLANDKDENKTTTGVDMSAGLRIEKILSKRFRFFAMPSMRWNLTKYNIKNSLVSKRLNQLCVGVGITYQMK